ncbi:MAG TPA: hypothetical protein VF621_19025 [Pyrinomonadaceae bacterium]|jgi:hypothetical protein
MKTAHGPFGKTLALAAAAALLLLLAQPPDASAQAAPRQTGAFKVSSLKSPFGVQLEVEGTYTVNEDYVEVSVDRALIYVSERCPYQGRRLVTTLSVGLGAATPRGAGSWEIENRSLPLAVDRVLSPREEYRLAGLRFQIPRNEGADLTKRWLIFETEELALDAPEPERDVKGYAYAHSGRCLFAHPCGEAER